MLRHMSSADARRRVLRTDRVLGFYAKARGKIVRTDRVLRFCAEARGKVLRTQSPKVLRRSQGKVL